MHGTRLFVALALVASAGRAEPDAKVVKTWKTKCATCHGVGGKADTDTGKKAQLPDFTTAVWQSGKTDAQIKASIENGAKKGENEMDPYKDKLTPEQIDGLVAYVRGLKS
jgi:mono/diheme cytochrome c family protein